MCKRSLRKKMFRLGKNKATLVAMLFMLSILPISFALTTQPNVTQVSLFVQESLVGVYPEPASSLIIQLENYADFDQIEMTLNVIVNTPKEKLHWLCFCGLESPVLSAVSASGNIGRQKDNQWVHYGEDEKLIITINGEFNVNAAKLKPGRILTVSQLAYGTQDASTPLLTISVSLKAPDSIDDGLQLEANASLKKLELEIASVKTDDIDLGYFNGLLWESRAYYAEEDYQSSLNVSSNSLKELRDAKKADAGFWVSLSKGIQNYWFLAVVSAVVLVGYAFVKRRNSRTGND